MTGMSESKLLEDAREPALRQVRMDLALAAVIKSEAIEASDEEVEAEYQKLADQYGMDLEMVKKYIQADQVRDQVVSQKAIAVVVDSATAVKPKAAKKTAKKAEEKPAGEAESEEKPRKTAKKTAKKAADGEEKTAARKSTKKAVKEEE